MIRSFSLNFDVSDSRSPRLHLLPDSARFDLPRLDASGAVLNVPGTFPTIWAATNPLTPSMGIAPSFDLQIADEFTATFTVFDSNMDVNKATYELLDATGNVVAGPFDVDLVQAIKATNLVRGQRRQPTEQKSSIFPTTA